MDVIWGKGREQLVAGHVSVEDEVKNVTWDKSREQPGALHHVPAEDEVNHPAHYTKGNIEVIDFIESQPGLRNNYHLASVVKYICRAPYKGVPLLDLRKARWYLDRFIQLTERENKP